MDSPNVIEDTERFAGLVKGVQINDWREPPRGIADRVLPGDGIIDLPAIFGALERGGYNGWYDIEVFSDDGRWGTELPGSLWKLPSADVVRRGAEGFRLAWNAMKS